MKLTTLQAYVENTELEYERRLEDNPDYSIPFCDEELVWAIQDYYSMRGEWQEEDYSFLEKEYDFDRNEVEFIFGHDPATGLSIDDEEE